ncbi:juvenile hormone acid O-methyltransferase-like [Phlebotomus argentipes]|uniref:juvenile hormone acid O-methyltransferase-like n=1 Tax=Phlebotomus argentipes TaxID=94469 RepID=UPI002892BF2E|nr:juvenile hormone acid O-methyltransferase-like [Phlebotomus argentipes]
MSFENAKAYSEGNNYTKVYTKVLLDEFFDWIEWRKDGKDSVLDIGSGPGNTIRVALYPRLSSNFSRLVLSDISEPMVELQKREFAGIGRVSCEVLDIGVEIDGNLARKLGTFDHVTSFFCLMWIKDQQQAMDNIYSLLKPGGDCFLVIVADSPVIDAILSVCEKPRWKEYFTGWQDFYVYPYRMLDEAKAKALKFMERSGFEDLKAEFRQDPFEFGSDKAKENFLKSMPSKFAKNVTAEEEEEIFQERLQYFDQFVLGQYRDNAGRIEKPNTYLILYGKKNK